MTRAEWAKLTMWLAAQQGAEVTIDWALFDTIVGGVPVSAVDHYPQWWHGDRPNTRAWRAAGYEVASVEPGRCVTFRRNGQPPDMPSVSPLTQHYLGADLLGEDPSQALIILQCSADKSPGGQMPSEAPQPIWPSDLYHARQQLCAIAHLDTSRVLPAWRRYRGRFYKGCAPVLRDAVGQGANIVIVSGGYGLITAGEPIGCYDRIFKLSDWPPGCLQRALLHHVARSRPRSVIAFVSATTDYAKLIRKTPWTEARIPVHLVTRQAAQDGAMTKVPKRLAEAFSAYWSRRPEAVPGDINLERLA